jgi:hypothetical protein
VGQQPIFFRPPRDSNPTPAQGCVCAAWLYFFVFFFRDRAAYGRLHPDGDIIRNWQARSTPTAKSPRPSHPHFKLPPSLPCFDPLPLSHPC